MTTGGRSARVPPGAARQIGCDAALGQAVAEPVGAAAVRTLLAERNR